jgi:hypothetical protein
METGKSQTDGVSQSVCIQVACFQKIIRNENLTMQDKMPVGYFTFHQGNGYW